MTPISLSDSQHHILLYFGSTFFIWGDAASMEIMKSAVVWFSRPSTVPAAALPLWRSDLLPRHLASAQLILDSHFFLWFISLLPLHLCSAVTCACIPAAVIHTSVHLVGPQQLELPEDSQSVCGAENGSCEAPAGKWPAGRRCAPAQKLRAGMSGAERGGAFCHAGRCRSFSDTLKTDSNENGIFLMCNENEPQNCMTAHVFVQILVNQEQTEKCTLKSLEV